MSELKPLFVDLDDTYGADELGLPYRDIVGEGYVSGLAVSQRAAGINLSVDVAAGSAWVQGDTDTSAQPTYRCRNDAVVNLGITPDGSNPRNVIIVAEVLDDTFDGGGSLLWRLRAVHGTAAAVPADPATPTSAIRLARINVTAADASIADAQIDDLRAPANFGGGNIKLWAKGPDVASAATIAVTHPFHDVTGTVTITSITAQSAGFVVTLQFDGILTFTDGSNLKIGGNFTTAAESTITLVCDGTNWYELCRSPAPAGGATVATTVAGLGTATGGKIGLIRAGSTPFDFVQVIYDATYAKWVSAPCVGASALWVGTLAAPATWTTLESANAQVCFGRWFPWAVLDTGGLVPQFRVSGTVQQNTSGAGHLRPSHFGVNAAGVRSAVVGVTAVDLSSAASTERMLDSGWVALTAGYTVYDFIMPIMEAQGNGGNAVTIRATQMIRWVG